MNLPDLMCACATARRASRLVTRMYDRHLRPFGLEATQYALLASIHAQPGQSQTTIAAELGFEKATLSRNLRLMERKGWAAMGRGVTLTEEGRAVFQQAQAGWTQAHAELQTKMGSESWQAMWQGLRAMSVAANEAVRS